MIGGRYSVETVVASPRSGGRYRHLELARDRADEIDGIVVNLAEGERVVYWSPGALEAFETGKARTW